MHLCRRVAHDQPTAERVDVGAGEWRDRAAHIAER
jgi:hypothetical protein